jgi:hypothetical protein
MVHVPAHVGITGNEEADKQANNGAAQPQEEVSIDLATAMAAIKRHTSKQLLTALKNIKTNTTKKKEEQSANIYWKFAMDGSIDQLPRYQQVAVRRMRTGHTLHLAEYQWRIGKTDDRSCPNCKNGVPDTQLHFLHDCPALVGARMSRRVWHPGELAAYLEEAGRISPPKVD